MKEQAKELQLMPEQASTELDSVKRAMVALNSKEAEGYLSTLAAKYKDVMVITSRKDYGLVMGALGEFRRFRNSIERTGKMARDDATKFSRAVIAEERRLIGIIEPEETRLTAVRRVWDDEQARIKREAEERKEMRREDIRQKIFGFAQLVQLAVGTTSDEVAETVQRLSQIVITEAEFQEFARQAETALAAATEQAKDLLARTATREAAEKEAAAHAKAEAEQRERERAELERLRAEHEQRQHEEAEQLRQEKAQIEAKRAEIARQQAELKRQQEAAEAERKAKEQQEAARQAKEERETAVAKIMEDARQQAQEEEQQATRPTLAEELEGWRIRFKISQTAHDALLEILMRHK